MDRCLQRHSISRLPDVEGAKPTKKKFKTYPIGYFHIDIAEVESVGLSSALLIERKRCSGDLTLRERSIDAVASNRRAEKSQAR